MTEKDWTPEEDEAFNEIEKKSNLGKQILQEIKPKRGFVGLTDEEIFAEVKRIDPDEQYLSKALTQFAKDIEAKLKEKNT